MSASEAKLQPAGQCPFRKADGAVRSDVTLANPEIISHPTGFYRALREGDPVRYDPELKMYLVSRYEDMQTVLQDPFTYSVKHGYEAQNAKGFQEEFRDILRRKGGGFFHDGIMTDPPEHTRTRRLLEKAFTAHRVKQLEPGIREIAVDLIEGLADKGAADGVNDFAAPYTIRVICKQLGMKVVNAAKIKGWSTAATAQIGNMQDREQMLAHAEKYCELQNAIIELIRERQKQPSEDMMSDLVYARLDDDEKPTLEFGELVALGRALLVGGNDTTSGAIGTLLLLLATQPEVVKQLHDSVNDDRMMTRFVEEYFRMEAPTRGLARMTTREVELGGTRLPTGAHMLLLYGSANEDEAEFPNSRNFDMNRSNLSRHLTFGSGVHRCVGLALARMEVKVAAQEIARRLDNIQLAVPLEDLKYQPTIAMHVLKSLPLTFTRHR